MSNYKKYDEDFKKKLGQSLSWGKTQSSLCKEYGVAQTAISRWIKLYSEVEMESGELITAASEGTPKTKGCFRRGEPYLKKSDCHIHATLHQ